MIIRKNLYVDQGVDYVLTINLADPAGEEYIVSDQEFYCSVRKIYSSNLSFEADFDIVDGDDSDANVNMIFHAHDTKDKKPGKYQYDVIMVTTTGATVKIAEGLLFLNPTITRGL